jgi:threonine aldolase
MRFASDNTSGAAPEVMAALLKANEGYERSYGADAAMARVTAHWCARSSRLPSRGPPRRHRHGRERAGHRHPLPTLGRVFCHTHAHIAEDECNAPEFYSGAKLVLVPATTAG